uniref:Molybdopterin biosynthesis protein n=1 Tax=Polysiphonia sp. TaxID=1967842 RepID=A0A1Z1M3Q1_9FLOR|nr:Molybdopterin biosynthesis protein [Polysiphonia sp.]
MLNIKSNHTIKISQEEYKRYSNQLILEHIGIKGQKKLKKAKVLIIGAGGLGCPAMIYLAIAGIGCIGLIDEDQIESSNLNRQLLYNINDINKCKVIIAKKKLKTLNEYSTIVKHEYELNIENSIEIICYYDIIIDATDNFKTRYIIDKTCYQLNKTYIYGAVDQFEGQIAIFNYKNGIRYKNLYKKNLELEGNSCNRNGIMGINTGYIGTLQAIETIKIILGLNKKCKNFLLLHNIIQTKTEKLKIYLKRDTSQRSNNYIINNKSKNILSINKWKRINNKMIIIDLRQNSDFNKKHLNKSINIPIVKFKSIKTIKFIQYYLNNNKLIIYCNNTEKSIIASYLLKNKAIQHYILS